MRAGRVLGRSCLYAAAFIRHATAPATRADVRMVQATSRFRIRPKSAGRSSSLSCTATSDDPMNSFTGENSRRICEPMSGQRIDPACPVKTTSKASPTWAASMAARPASPSRRRARAKGSATKTSWQSATPVKPIARHRRPTKNSAALRLAAIVPGTANLSCRYLDPAGRRRSKLRLTHVLDLLEYGLVADHQRHHVRHHRQPSRL